MVADGCYRFSSHRTSTSNDGQLYWVTLDPLKECIQCYVVLTLEGNVSIVCHLVILFIIKKKSILGTAERQLQYLENSD